MVALLTLEGGAPYLDASGPPQYEPDELDSPFTYPLQGYQRSTERRESSGLVFSRWVPLLPTASQPAVAGRTTTSISLTPPDCIDYMTGQVQSRSESPSVSSVETVVLDGSASDGGMGPERATAVVDLDAVISASEFMWPADRQCLRELLATEAGQRARMVISRSWRRWRREDGSVVLQF